MTLRLAFAGLRHAHIFSLYRSAMDSDEMEVVAVCEEDGPARAALAESGKCEVTHDLYEQMLAEVDCDAVAIGDYYTKRGPTAICALEAGRHIVLDKPICTRLDELDRIEELSAAKGLKVGCMLDMRNNLPFQGMRQLIRDGRIGEVCAIGIGGQHPLMLGSRPGWYFEPGKHGGTINDIGIHAVDYLPWATGLRFARVNAARCWNATVPQYPHFKEAGQFMATLENGCGVLCDVSYYSPDSMGYGFPLYWRATFWGSDGVIEASSKSEIMLAVNGEKEPRTMPLPEPTGHSYLTDFLLDLAGRPRPEGLSTATVLRSARNTLLIQNAADEGMHDVALG